MHRDLDPTNLSDAEDWEGNNIAFACPVCAKVFIVSGHMHRGRRSCPNCGKSTGVVTGGRESGGTASISWSQ